MVAEGITQEKNETRSLDTPFDDTVRNVQICLKEGDTKTICYNLEQMHASDIASLISHVRPEERAEVVPLIPDAIRPEVLVELEPDIKNEVVASLGTTQVARDIATLELDDAIDIIEDFDELSQRKIIRAVGDKLQRKELRQSLAYPEDSAARMMTKDFVVVPQGWDVGKVIDYLRSHEEAPEDFYSLFVVDKQGHPVGNILVSRIIRKQRNVKLSDIMDAGAQTVDATMDQEEVAHLFQKYGLASAPVLDEDGTMVGIITVDDIVHVMQEEASEDILKMGNVASSDIHASYITTAKKRAPWLAANLVTAVLASLVIAIYDEVIEKLVAIAVLMPIVASMAANAGTQTLTVAVRAIATKELTSTNAWRIVGKEMLAATMNGAAFGVLAFIGAALLYQNYMLATVFGLATFGAFLLAALSGILVPLGLVKYGVDPAIASSVFVTTFTDISAFFFFLGLASWWMF